jgi:hypothetical protein
MRIVSLLPSATEIVCALGLGECLVARSHECDYPPEIQDRPVITYSLIPPDLPSHEIDRMVSETLMTHATLYGLDVALLQRAGPRPADYAGVMRCVCGVVQLGAGGGRAAESAHARAELGADDAAGRAGHFSAGGGRGGRPRTRAPTDCAVPSAGRARAPAHPEPPARARDLSGVVRPALRMRALDA